jgi:hypothetical protein
MKRHHPSGMSRAFDEAFSLIKMNHLTSTYGVELFDEMLVKAFYDGELRKNIEDYMHMSLGELADLPPDEKEYAFTLLQQHLAAQPKATADPQAEAPAQEEAPPEPVAKAFRALLDAHFGLY